MLNYTNYFDNVKKLDFSSLPSSIQQTHRWIIKITDAGQDWSEYLESDGIREAIDIYFEKADKYVKQSDGTDRTNTRKQSSKKNISENRINDQPPKSRSNRGQSTKPGMDARENPAGEVEHLDEEVKFIKRYVSLHGKTKEDKQLLNFINSLQRAIIERKIKKTSRFAEQIRYIQDNVIRVYNSMGKTISIKIKEDKLNEFRAIIESEKVRFSVSYIKRYISMQGKLITKEKAKKLLDIIERAISKNQIPANDLYINKISQLQTCLINFISKESKIKTLPINSATLNGWQDALGGCGCGKGTGQIFGLSGFEGGNIAPEVIMNSEDFAKAKFKTLGFKGKWLDLIGDPAANFTAMIFGKPKLGKSHLALDFAGYLARNFGYTLYVANEEKLQHTLQAKINSVKHPNLDVTGSLPADLSPYSFIFLDSVTYLGLKPDDLRNLREKYPEKSFIFVFQTTKQGNFKGENAFQHDVDIVIEVPEKGHAVQMGRYNQGGEMNIFDTPLVA